MEIAGWMFRRSRTLLGGVLLQVPRIRNVRVLLWIRNVCVHIRNVRVQSERETKMAGWVFHRSRNVLDGVLLQVLRIRIACIQRERDMRMAGWIFRRSHS